MSQSEPQSQLGSLPTRILLDLKGKDVNGKLIIELDGQNAPNLTHRFKQLVKTKKYNGTQFHRIIAPEFIIQGGRALDRALAAVDPIDDENVRLVNKGDVCMANEGENMNKTEFFIALEDLSSYSVYAPVIGKVIKGYEVLNQFSEILVDDDDVPLYGHQVVISQAALLKFQKRAVADHNGFDSVATNANEPSQKKKQKVKKDGIILKGRGSMKFRETRDEYKTRGGKYRY